MSNVSKTTQIVSAALGAGLVLTLVSETVSATDACNGLPSQADLKSALLGAVGSSNGGLNNNMWATIVNADGNDLTPLQGYRGLLASVFDLPWLVERDVNGKRHNRVFSATC